MHRSPAETSWRVVRLLLEAVIRSASAVEGALTPVPSRWVVVDVALGGGAVAGDLAGRAGDRLADVARSIGRVLGPPLGEWLGPIGGLRCDRPGPSRALARLAERGRRERAAAGADLHRLAVVLVPAVTAALLDRLDLTGLVRDRVALDALVAEVDLDAVAARIDVDAIVDRLDLIALANRTIDGIDLPEIIRESTDSITGDLVRGVRVRGVSADLAVTGLVARLLRRRLPSETDAPLSEPRASS